MKKLKLFFANPEYKRKQQRFHFTKFKHISIREVLITLFHGKCAYCESSIIQFNTIDIDHSRPKTSVIESSDHPGYWWLVNDWGNLLWSCIFCNRKNNLDEANIEGLKPFGKKNRFPISNEAKRIRSHNKDVKTEKELLLIVNPCTDNPDDYF